MDGVAMKLLRQKCSIKLALHTGQKYYKHVNMLAALWNTNYALQKGVGGLHFNKTNNFSMEWHRAKISWNETSFMVQMVAYRPTHILF